jgi:hypothetical protein
VRSRETVVQKGVIRIEQTSIQGFLNYSDVTGNVGREPVVRAYAHQKDSAKGSALIEEKAIVANETTITRRVTRYRQRVNKERLYHGYIVRCRNAPLA